MKNYHLLKPPSVPMPDEETLKAIKEVPREEVKKVLSSEKYQTILANRKQRKLHFRKQWFSQNLLQLLGLFFSFVAAVASIIALWK